jgi:succinate-semialdehyde dehydrogenase/glutarate-semialdehyde dehydrogenase
MKQCAATVKRLSLELGGNAPFIVFDDADLDQAVSGALVSKFRNAGQTCVCANRFLVQDGVYDAFIEKLVERVQLMKVGNGAHAGVDLGPLIDLRAVTKVKRHLADAVKRGARIVTGGRSLGDRFFEPTVLADATSDMMCATEETFGPVAPIIRFRDEAEAVAAANASEYGLASYLYSRDIGRVVRVGEALECGMVGINTGLISSAEVPFGGVKQSGLGREGARQGIDEYVDVKLLCVGGVDA